MDYRDYRSPYATQLAPGYPLNAVLLRERNITPIEPAYLGTLHCIFFSKLRCISWEHMIGEFVRGLKNKMLFTLVTFLHNFINYRPVPYYAAANRGKAAVCNLVITLHDEEHTYLRGHVIRS